MNISESFDFIKRLEIEEDTTDSHVHVDISRVTSSKEKLTKAISGFIGFLATAGFEGDEVYEVAKEIINAIGNHPDNDDFALHSAVEEQVNNEKDYNEFLNHIDKSVETNDTDFLKDVYRCYIIMHMKEDD
jgi:cation transport regulator ChaC